MKKIPISQAAEILGISKEAVYNRIRRGSLKCKDIGGVKYVLLDESKTPNSDFVAFLITQNTELKSKNDRLQKEKEQIIIAKIDELKNAYQSNDERLKMIISMMKNPQIQSQNSVQNFSQNSAQDAEILEIDEAEKNSLENSQENLEWVSLGQFLQKLFLNEKKTKKVEQYLIKCVGFKKFVKCEDGVIFVKSTLKYKKLREKF